MNGEAPSTPATPAAPARAVLDEGEHAARVAAGHPAEDHLTLAYGFLPATRPLPALPPSHAAWDAIAAELPSLFRRRRVRAALRALPRLSAREEDLDSAYLCRASVIMSFLAHAFVRGDLVEDRDLPAHLLEPWQDLGRRLGRPGPAFTGQDMYGYNFCLRDPAAPLRLDNLDMMVHSTGSAAERVFFMVHLEMVAMATPLVGAVVRAQEAVVAGDTLGLRRGLALVTDTLRAITFASFLKIDVNEHAPTHLDPVVWAKCVGSFTASIRAGEPGLSGASIPFFHVLDALFSRGAYATTIGHEAQAFLAWQPPRYRRFLSAIRALPIRPFVEAAGDPALRGAFQSALDAYAGDKGFLGLHRLKLFGFLELAFKVGRNATNGGFTGTPGGRAWDRVDDEIEKARRERYVGHSLEMTRARRTLVAPICDEEDAPVRRVRLDLTGCGVRYQAGDRLAVLCQNAPEQVERTLRALRATGEEPIGLTQAWRETLALLQGSTAASTVPLRTFLEHARLRPVPRSVGKALYDLTRHPRLRAVLEARQEDQWELWEFLDLIGAGTYDTRRLWHAGPWDRESLARIVPPERPRLYSISSAPDPDPRGDARTVELTVGALQYSSDHGGGPVPQRGVASNFLVDREARSAAVNDPGRSEDGVRVIPVRVIRPSRFRLPDDPTRPIAMFAGGTGISPFRGFMKARSALPSAGATWLFLGTRDERSFYCRRELTALVEQGRLELRVAFSRADLRATSQGGAVVLQSQPRGHVDTLLQEQDAARALWQMIRSRRDGGQGGTLYVCGQTRFAATAVAAIKATIARFAPDGSDEASVNRRFFTLQAEGRLMMDIFTTFAPAAAAGVLGHRRYDASEIVLHNDDQHGHWMVIQGNVYDVTQFLHLHPGGRKILTGLCGMDATRSYEKVEHHLSSEVHAMLDLYKIGAIRRLDFGSAWGIALGQKVATDSAGPPRTHVHHVSLHDLYRRWARYAYEVVEAENTLHSDVSVRACALTLGEEPLALTPMKLHLLAEAHERFVAQTLPGLCGAVLDSLWATTIGLCAPREGVLRLRRALEALFASPERHGALGLAERARAHAERLGEEAPAAAWATASALLDVLRDHDARVLGELKLLVRTGLQVFEEHEARTISDGAAALVAVLPRIPALIAAYFQDVQAAFPV